MTKLLIIGMGGFFGAIARYGLSGLAHRAFGATFPYGTLAVNVVGCLLIGAVLYLVEDRTLLSPNMRMFLAVGCLGAFTTFSTFGYETLELIQDREFWLATLNVAANVVLGLAAVWLGRTVLRALVV